MNTPIKRPPRLVMRVTPHDRYVLNQIREHTPCQSDSDAVRNALAAIHLATRQGAGRFVLRNEALREQEGVWARVATPTSSEPLSTGRTLDVPLHPEAKRHLDELLQEGRFGTEKSQVVRSALDFFWELTSRLSSGWRFGIRAVGGAFQEIPLRGLPAGVGTGAPQHRITEAVLAYLRGEVAKAAAHVRRRLRRCLAEVANRTRGSSATVFLTEEDRIVALEVYNVTRNLPRIDLGGQGIVPHVLRTGRAYYTNNVKEDRFYREDNPATRSEIAVPIVVDGIVLGCLNIESDVQGMFSSFEIEAAEEAARQIIPELIVHLGLADEGDIPCPWHPDLHGWDLEAICEGICFAVTDGIDAEHTHTAIWYHDTVKEELFLYATTGYASDFRYDRTLPLPSATGRIATARVGVVKHIDPTKDAHFLYRERAQRLGITRILATPIYSEGQGRNIATLHAYLNRIESDRPDVREALAQVAGFVGPLADRFETRRQAVCRARLRHLLQALPADCESDFDAIRDFFRVVFASPGVTLLALPAGDHRLYLASTTGLIRAADWRWPGDPLGTGSRTIPEGPLYDLEEDQGITAYMACHPGLSVRKNNVLNRAEPGLPADFPRESIFRYVEDFRPDFRDQRRVLIGSVGVADEGYAAGVVRCVRPGRSKPFTGCDERLFQALLVLCTPSFLGWRQSWADTRLPWTGPDERTELDPMKPELFRPFPAAPSTEALIGQLLRWLFLWFKARGHGVLWASLLLRHRSANEERFRVKSFFSDEHRLPPVDDRDSPLPEVVADPRLRWGALFNRGTIVSFTGVKGQANSGIRVPLMGWSGPAPVQGVLAVDSSGGGDWTINDVELFYHAAWRLVTIWNRTAFSALAGPALNPRFKEIEMSRLLFGAFPSEVMKRCGLSSCRLFLLEGEQCVPERPDPWPHIDAWEERSRGDRFRSDWKDLASFGVCGRPDRKGVAVPLRLGLDVVGELRCQSEEFDLPERVVDLVRMVTALWSSITFGHSPYPRLHFAGQELPLTSGEDGPGLPVVKRWAARLSGLDVPPSPATRGPKMPPLLIDYCGGMNLAGRSDVWSS